MPSLVFSTASSEELYERHVQAVFRFAVSVAGQRDVAEDLVLPELSAEPE